jgi:renalase
VDTPRVEVVGAGIAGAACARALQSAGVDVVVRERGRAPGGRLAAPTLHGRRVDVGAAYFTVKDAGFRDLVEGWQHRGLVRQWTDTLDVVGGDATSGPMRWAAPDGLRALARDLLADLDVTLGDEVQSVTGPVVLAMPDPQAARIVASIPGVDWVEFEPVIAVVLGFQQRCWPTRNAAFVNDDAELTLVADDGARRGDGAAVLVAHTTSSLARAHLAAPEQVVPIVLDALRRTLGVTDAPAWTHAHRWTLAKPAATHGDAPFALTDDLLGLCGDAWCPNGAPRVESAWLSGHRLGAELASRLARRAEPSSGSGATPSPRCASPRVTR